MKRLMQFLGLAIVFMLCPRFAMAQQGRAVVAPPDLEGVYQALPDRMTIPEGRKNSGSPAAIELLPEAKEQLKSIDLKKDPWKMCQPVGPFRMMAAEQAKIELVPVRTMIVMLFEDLSHGMMRTIYLTRGHPAKLEPTWLGDSVGRWEGDTLVVDTTGFNDRTWLNENGARPSGALHLSERIQPIAGGRYLKYVVTAEDPKILAKPYTYTRYYQKLYSEIQDDICVDQD
jgi:hypothetical protein